MYPLCLAVCLCAFRLTRSLLCNPISVLLSLALQVPVRAICHCCPVSGLILACFRSLLFAENYKMVSRVLQRTLCIITAFCVPALVAWYYSEFILVSIGQDPEISHLAARYARLCMPGLWPSLAYQAIVTYLQCQGIMGAEVYVGAAMNAYDSQPQPSDLICLTPLHCCIRDVDSIC
jgi:Na+-driven multidrug efflux pump